MTIATPPIAPVDGRMAVGGVIPPAAAPVGSDGRAATTPRLLYLHPVGENLLLGVGREGDGVNASRFDVSKLAAPREVAHLQFASSFTAVENEPHSAPKQLVILPLQDYQRPFSGAVGIHVDPTTLSEIGRITHEVDGRPEFAPVERSLVIGDRLYSLSYFGLSAGSVDSLAPLAYTALQRGAPRRPEEREFRAPRL